MTRHATKIKTGGRQNTHQHPPGEKSVKLGGTFHVQSSGRVAMCGPGGPLRPPWCGLTSSLCLSLFPPCPQVGLIERLLLDPHGKKSESQKPLTQVPAMSSDPSLSAKSLSVQTTIMTCLCDYRIRPGAQLLHSHVPAVGILSPTALDPARAHLIGHIYSK